LGGPPVARSPMVAIVAGSKSDRSVVEDTTKMLKELGVSFEVEYISAHRNPLVLHEYVAGCGAKVFIGIAGLAAHLPGAIASQTTKPVVGVPVGVKFGGLDSLLSVVQMPPGVPVATVGVDNGKNAAILAAEILAIQDKRVSMRLDSMRRSWG
jgi:5-(carboxyamino)imidazole ribonucleotide mutase